MPTNTNRNERNIQFKIKKKVACFLILSNFFPFICKLIS